MQPIEIDVPRFVSAYQLLDIKNGVRWTGLRADATAGAKIIGSEALGGIRNEWQIGQYR